MKLLSVILMIAKHNWSYTLILQVHHRIFQIIHVYYAKLFCIFFEKNSMELEEMLLPKILCANRSVSYINLHNIISVCLIGLCHKQICMHTVTNFTPCGAINLVQIISGSLFLVFGPNVLSMFHHYFLQKVRHIV